MRLCRLVNGAYSHILCLLLHPTMHPRLPVKWFTQPVKDLPMSLLHTSSLLGREAIIDFPASRAEVHYSPEGVLIWKVTDCKGSTSEGRERLSYLQLSDTLHFLNWIEKSGFTVSQVVDTAQGTVKAFWSYTDERTEGGQRASMFVDGQF